MSYRPNMRPEDVRRLDARRGQPEDDMLDTYPTNTNPVNKEPWKIKTPVNKGNHHMLDLLDLIKNVSYEDEGEELEKDISPIPGFKQGPMKMNEAQAPQDEAIKALSSKNFPMLRPRGDEWDVFRSATTQTTRKHSNLYGPDGVAPLVGETISQVNEDELKRTTYKSCGAHGLVFRADRVCHPCEISKNSMCKGCGTEMMKSPGGMQCPNCG